MASRSEELLDQSTALMLPNYPAASVVAARGQGVYLWDVEGNRYLDFSGGIGVNALGHAHPKVAEAVARQAHRLCHTSNMFRHEGYLAVCAKLVELSFGEQVYLCNSGTEAVEAALKLARRYAHMRGEQRPIYATTSGAFHGRTLGALSVTAQPSHQEGFQPLLPNVRVLPFGDLDAAEALLNAERSQVAAIIVEPIQGNSGIRVPPAGYLAGLRALADQHNTLLIFDEVQTGIGRTGRWFAHEHDGATPHIMAVAKALGGGLPLGAMITTRDIGRAFTPGSHGTTFGGNPVACAASLACFSVLERDKLVPHAAALGDRFLVRLRSLADAHEQIIDVRGRGLLVGVETSAPIAGLRKRCAADGLLTSASGKHVLRFLPPLLVTESQIDNAVDILDRALGAQTAAD